MKIVLYYKCANCNIEFALDPKKTDDIVVNELGFYRLMDERKTFMMDNKILLHRCDDHTFGPAFFTYGKVVPG